MLVTLGENGIKTLDDFADLAGDELLEMLAASDKGGAKLELDEANALIMAARAHWFERERGRLGRQPRRQPRTGGWEGVDRRPARRRHVPPPATPPSRSRSRPQRRCIVTGESTDRGAIAALCRRVRTARSCRMSRGGCPDGVCG